MKIVDNIAKALRMTRVERDALCASRTAQLVGAIPFAAGCIEPERAALAHLAVYILAQRDGGRKAFDHNPSDDDGDRLFHGSHFEGGDESIIAHGMALLELNAIQGYEADQDKDRASGEYNPLVSGAWDFTAKREELLDEIAATPAGGLDEIVGLMPMIYWG
jgi:hypothetical protein